MRITDSKNTDGTVTGSIVTHGRNADLRETPECPCYKLTYWLEPGDQLPDHICRRTMRDSCFTYLGENGLAMMNLAGGSLLFNPAGIGLVRLEDATEWPWTVDGYGRSVLMVLRQTVEHEPTLRTMQVLRNHQDWPQAKRGLHSTLRQQAMSHEFREWQRANSSSDAIPQETIKAWELPLVYFGEELDEIADTGPDGQATPDGQAAMDGNNYDHRDDHNKFHQVSDLLAWFSKELPGPFGLSEVELRHLTRAVLRSLHLSDTNAAIDLLLSEVLPTTHGCSSTPRTLPNSLRITSFLLGDFTVAITASMIAKEERNIEITTYIDPDAAAARQLGLDSYRNPPVKPNGETTSEITVSSDWTRKHTIDAALRIVNSHKVWWKRFASPGIKGTDRRKVRGQRLQASASHEDEDDAELTDIKAYLTGTLEKTQLHERAYKRMRMVTGSAGTPHMKAKEKRRIDRRIRYHEDKSGTVRR